MNRIAVLVCAFVFISASCTKDSDPIILSEHVYAYDQGVVKLAGREVSVDFAIDTASQKKGLSGRPSLEENQGMLFIFNVADKPSFWMPDMHFPIDIIWIRGDTVVDISAEVPPEPGVALADLKTYSPAEPADRVLEVKAGWAARNGLKIGDKVEITRLAQN